MIELLDLQAIAAEHREELVDVGSFCRDRGVDVVSLYTYAHDFARLTGQEPSPEAGASLFGCGFQLGMLVAAELVAREEAAP